MKSLFLRFPDGRSKALTLSYDDGVQQDIRLLNMMTRRGVKGTFNINSELFAPEGTKFAPGVIHRRMTQQECVDLYKDNDCCEVAIHGAQHPFLESVTPPQAVYDVARDRYLLEQIFDRLIRGMAYPMGTFSDTVVDILRLAGVAYSRTTISSHNFDLPADPLRLQATCHHNDPKLMDLLETFLGEEPRRDGWLYYLWGHSYEFEINGNWNVIEAFLDRAAGHENVWYATNIEIMDYISAFRSLQISLDGKIVHNPTCITVWGLMDGKMVEVPAGATIHID